MGGENGKTNLLLVMQTLVVVLEVGHTFCGSGVVFGVCVCDVAGEDFLPEGEAAGGACLVGVMVRICAFLRCSGGGGLGRVAAVGVARRGRVGGGGRRGVGWACAGIYVGRAVVLYVLWDRDGYIFIRPESFCLFEAAGAVAVRSPSVFRNPSHSMCAGRPLAARFRYWIENKEH